MSETRNPNKQIHEFEKRIKCLEENKEILNSNTYNESNTGYEYQKKIFAPAVQFYLIHIDVNRRYYNAGEVA